MSSKKEKDYIDTFTLTICEKLGDYAYNLGLTPNLLTTLGVIARIISLKYLFYPNNNQWAKEIVLVFYLIGYFFDVFDGYFARRYGMSSVYGDYYDHITDWIFMAILVYYFIFRSTITSSKYFYHYLALGFVMYVVSIIYTGCGETAYKCQGAECSKTLSHLKDLCIYDRQSVLKYGKFCGLGAVNMYKAILLYLY